MPNTGLNKNTNNNNTYFIHTPLYINFIYIVYWKLPV